VFLGEFFGDGVMIVDVFAVGPIQANCTLVGDPDGGALAVIDPGEEAERILDRVARTGLDVTMVLHTHGHLDHAGGTADLMRRLPHQVPLGLHRDELEIYRSLAMQGMMFGIEAEAGPEPDLWLEHGQRLQLGSLTLEVRHTPGHSPGGVTFVVHGGPEAVAIVGDTLFAGSIGRTDLWGGSFETLERSIREQVYSLDDSTRLVCGHGPDTTVGQERATNPFVRG
jgi:glyoxylase-like metal-dependent hydrolase (beta-lactamase superfamily II)